MAKPTTSPVGTWLKDLDSYWFGKGSPTALGVMRILFSFFCLMNLFMLLPQFGDWFSNKGFVPADAGHTYIGGLRTDVMLPWGPSNLPFQIPRLNLLAYVTNDNVTMAFFLLTMMAAVFTLIGYKTKLSSIVLAICVVCLQHRNAIIIHGGDVVLRIGLLYLAMSPCGRACSVDRLLAIWKGKETIAAPFVSLWSQRLIAYNLALIYFTTFWIKFGFGSMWRDLTATYYPNRLHEFERFPMPPFLLNPPFIQITTAATLIIELALGTLVFYKPLRGWVLAAGLAMHAMIEYSMNIPMFALLICSMYVTMYSGEEISAWAKRWGNRLSRLKIKAFAPAGQTLSPNAAALTHAVDPFKFVTYQTGETEQWTATSAKGPTNPFGATALRSPGAWVFAWIPGVWRRLLEQSTIPLATDRLVGEDAPERPRSKKPSRAKS